MEPGIDEVAIADFTDLSQAHHQLDDLFTEHRVALIHFQIERSRQLLLEFRAGIEEHIRYEEEILLPVYERNGGDEIEGGRVDFYLNEHRKILRLLSETERTLSGLSIQRNSEGARKVLQVLGKEHSLKALLSHHDRREESFLYPFLDEVTTHHQKRELLSELKVRNREPQQPEAVDGKKKEVPSDL